METRLPTTFTNSLGAQKPPASLESSSDNVVTAVRMFSESLLANRVSKEVQQEVKALVTHMEVLIARRRMAARKSQTPSVAETRVALRNLKRFLEREANKERVNKPSASCTTDSLESSCAQALAYTPSSERTRSLCSLSVDPDTANNSSLAVCGSRGDSACRQLAATAAAEKQLLQCCVHQPDSGQTSTPKRQPPQQLQKQQHQKEPSSRSRSLHGPAQLVQLTCSGQIPLLLLPRQTGPPAGTFHVELLADGASTLTAARPAVAPEQEALAKEAGRSVVCMSRTEANAERPPRTAMNPQLEDEQPIAVAVERVMELPVLEAECGRGDSHRVQFDWSVRHGTGRILGSEKAVIERLQENSNCATVSSHVAIVRWAKATTIVDVDRVKEQSRRRFARSNQLGSKKMVSTCSCPSDSDACKAPVEKNAQMADTEESIDLQMSSVQAQHHSSIQATPMRLEQRVCESSSPEVVAPSASFQTVGAITDECQQPLFRIIDLMQLVHTAEPLFRSESPTEALGVPAAGLKGGDPAGAGDADSGSRRSESTLEVVDWSAGMVVPVWPELPASPAAAPKEEVVSSTLRTAAYGPMWSSCEVGESSGFTKLLLTLDKAAKRRREQAYSRRLLQKTRAAVVTSSAVADKTPPVAVASRGRQMSRSGKNIGNRPVRTPQHLQAHQQQQPQATPIAPDMRRQTEALRLTARSLAGLAKSLQVCVRRVHDAADAINEVM